MENDIKCDRCKKTVNDDYWEGGGYWFCFECRRRWREYVGKVAKLFTERKEWEEAWER